MMDCRDNLLVNYNRVASYNPWPAYDNKTYQQLLQKFFRGVSIVCGGCITDTFAGYQVCFDEIRDTCNNAVYDHSSPGFITLCPSFFDNWPSILQLLFITYSPSFWGDMAHQVRTAIMLHELIHLIDWEYFFQRYGIQPGDPMFAGTNASGTEYRAAYVQAMWLGLNSAEADIFGNAYSRWLAGEINSTVVYFIEEFINYHITNGTPGLAVALFMYQSLIISLLPVNPNPVIVLLNTLLPVYAPFWSFLALLQRLVLII
jgi:hypothetical protein